MSIYRAIPGRACAAIAAAMVFLNLAPAAAQATDFPEAAEERAQRIRAIWLPQLRGSDFEIDGPMKVSRSTLLQVVSRLGEDTSLRLRIQLPKKTKSLPRLRAYPTAGSTNRFGPSTLRVVRLDLRF